MKTLRNVCVWTAALAFCVAMSTAPVAGTWEGSVEGAKAVTLKVLDRDGKPGGSAIFYIMRDEGSGKHIGAASPETPIEDARWDGKVLSFSVHNPEGETIRFAMTLTGEDAAQLAVLDDTGKQQRSVPLLRRK